MEGGGSEEEWLHTGEPHEQPVEALFQDELRLSKPHLDQVLIEQVKPPVEHRIGQGRVLSSSGEGGQSLLHSADGPQWVEDEEQAEQLKRGLRKVRAGQATEEMSSRLQELEWVRVGSVAAKTRKVGVLPWYKGQTEDEAYGNREVTPSLQKLLDVLGDTVELATLSEEKDYLGGLSCEGLTGSHSVRTEHEGYSFMFHVSPMLPFMEENPQQIQRKRHLGNDLCCIIFTDDPEPFDAEQVASQMTHVFLVVRETPEGYVVRTVYKGNVPHVPPRVPAHPLTAEQLRPLLLWKLINSERATLVHAPAFKRRVSRHHSSMLERLHEDFADEEKLEEEGIISSVISTVSSWFW